MAQVLGNGVKVFQVAEVLDGAHPGHHVAAEPKEPNAVIMVPLNYFDQISHVLSQRL